MDARWKTPFTGREEQVDGVEEWKRERQRGEKKRKREELDQKSAFFRSFTFFIFFFRSKQCRYLTGCIPVECAGVGVVCVSEMVCDGSMLPFFSNTGFEARNMVSAVANHIMTCKIKRRARFETDQANPLPRQRSNLPGDGFPGQQRGQGPIAPIILSPLSFLSVHTWAHS